jgi:hypothetical protein
MMKTGGPLSTPNNATHHTSKGCLIEPAAIKTASDNCSLAKMMGIAALQHRHCSNLLGLRIITKPAQHT